MIDYANKIRFIYYEASDGPRLVLFGPLDVDLKSLQALFRQLAATPNINVQLDEQPFVMPRIKIRLSSYDMTGKRPKIPRCGLWKIQDDAALSYQWSRTCEEWDDLAELIDGLVKTTQAGHQYMTRYPDEDAIVVVSKGEYIDDVLEL